MAVCYIVPHQFYCQRNFFLRKMERGNCTICRVISSLHHRFWCTHWTFPKHSTVHGLFVKFWLKIMNIVTMFKGFHIQHPQYIYYVKTKRKTFLVFNGQNNPIIRLRYIYVESNTWTSIVGTSTLPSIRSFTTSAAILWFGIVTFS